MSEKGCVQEKNVLIQQKRSNVMNAGWVVKKVEYDKWAINGRNSISKALGSYFRKSIAFYSYFIHIEYAKSK